MPHGCRRQRRRHSYAGFPARIRRAPSEHRTRSTSRTAVRRQERSKHVCLILVCPEWMGRRLRADCVRFPLDWHARGRNHRVWAAVAVTMPAGRKLTIPLSHPLNRPNSWRCRRTFPLLARNDRGLPFHLDVKSDVLHFFGIVFDPTESRCLGGLRSTMLQCSLRIVPATYRCIHILCSPAFVVRRSARLKLIRTKQSSMSLVPDCNLAGSDRFL